MQPHKPAGGPRVIFAASGSESGFVRESQDDEEDHHVSIGDAPMIEIAQSFMFVFSLIPLVLFLLQ